MSYTRALFSSRFSCLAGILFFVTEFPSCQVGSANGNPSGSPLANRFRRPTWRNGYTWVMILPESSAWRIFLLLCRVLFTKIIPPNKSYLKKHLQHQDQRGSLTLLHGNLMGPRVLHHSGKERRHRLPSLKTWAGKEPRHRLPHSRPGCNFIHPRQLSPFPERLKLPFSIEEILSGFEDVVSSGTDQCTTWVKTDPDATLVRHMVDVQKAVAEFRKASERRHDTSSQAYRLHKSISNRSPVQKRLSMYNWNPGPRRGKENAFA